MFLWIFELLLKYNVQFYLVFNFWNSCEVCTIGTIMRTVIKKEIAHITHEIVIVRA